MFLLPKPRQIVAKEKEFIMDYKTKIEVDCKISNILLAVELKEFIADECFVNVEIEKRIFFDEKNAILITLDKNLGDEEYKISITENNVCILGGSEKACFYGVQTLKQIIKNKKNILPSLDIHDYPTIKNRVFYYDCGRGKVPTFETMKKIVDKCAAYKINQIQFYTEHAFKFDGFSEVWCGIDALTKEDILKIDAYCKERYVELVPSIPTFGHLYDVLATDSFGSLCELENPKEETAHWAAKSSHHTLDISNPKSFELVKQMIDETMPLFSSDKFNICCDETFDLGKGKNKGKDTGELYVDFLCKIINYLKTYNKKVMFWGDVVAEHVDAASKIPDDCIILNWHYSKAGVKKSIEKLKDTSFEKYGSCACSGYHRFYADLKEAYDNIGEWCKLAHENSYNGIVICEWGDWGHFSPIELAIPSLIYGAALSWNYESEFENYTLFNEYISFLEYGDEKYNIYDKIYEIAAIPKTYWMQIGFWLDNYKGRYTEEKQKYFWVEYHTKESIINVTEEFLKAAYEKINYIADRLLTIPTKRNSLCDLENVYIMAKGLALSMVLVLHIKKYSIKQPVEDEMLSTFQLASELEIWMENVLRCWRKYNRNSEVNINITVIREICNWLRNC